MKSRRVTHVQRLEDLSCHSDKFIAEVMCQLVTQAKIEEFPERWQAVEGPQRTRPRRDASIRRRQL
jgi:hypothetical protein